MQLDKRFLEFGARLPPAYVSHGGRRERRRRVACAVCSFKLAPGQMEKHLLRQAFVGWIPDDVLWRAKEGFSEALGRTDLGDVVNAHAERVVTSAQWEQRAVAYPWKTPAT